MATVNKDSEFVMKTLMDIKNDIGEVKTEIKGLIKSVDENSADTKNEIAELNDKISKLDDRVDALERADDVKDSKKYRTVLNYIWVAIGTFFITKFPSIVKYVAGLINQE